MIRHLRHSEIDKAAWDRRIAACATPWWYGRSWVLDAASPGWEALVDEASGAQLALTWRRRFGIKYLYQPFLLQRVGVFGGAPSALLGALPDEVRYADIYLNDGDRQGVPADVRLTEQRNHELSLDATLEEIRNGYAQNLRRNLRKAAPYDLVIDAGADVGEVLAFLRGSEQFKRWGIDPVRIACMERLLAGAMVQGEGRPYAVRVSGRTVAAAFFVEWGGRLLFLKGLANAEGRAVQAMHRLLDRVIATHAGSALVLDLAGSNDEDLARFYAGFGARRTVYLRAQVNRLPPLVRLLKP